jgi:hypothetical protein
MMRFARIDDITKEDSNNDMMNYNKEDSLLFENSRKIYLMSLQKPLMNSQLLMQ